MIKEEPWSSKDAEFLRKFVEETPTGRKLVTAFKARRPQIGGPNGQTIEARAMQASELGEWEKTKEFIKNAMVVIPEETPVDTGVSVEDLDVVE